MKNVCHSVKILAFALSLLLLLLGMIPALATEAEPAITEENVLSELEAANSPAQLFQHHTFQQRHEEAYAGGEVFYTTDIYATAESAFYFFGEDYVCYITPTSFTDYSPDEGIAVVLMLPEENAEELESHQMYFAFTDGEVPESLEEQDGELLITTRVKDADLILAYFETKREIFGDKYGAEYRDGAEIVFQYRVDAADLTAKEYLETLCMPDGSELPLSHVTIAYDEEMPDPTAPDCPLAPAFDEAAETRLITVVFEPETPEEQTYQYTVPMGIPGYIQYNGEYAKLYADAACTQPFTNSEGLTEFTVYAKAAEQ